MIPASAARLTPSKRKLGLLAASGALILGASAAIAFRGPVGIDYDHDAQPAIDALLRGDLGGFFDSQPLMGMFSLLLRAPFVALADLVGGGELVAYRLGALPCLVAAGFVGLWLWRRMHERGAPAYAGVAVAGFFLFNPLVFFALQAGHPEEILGAALCVAALLAAAERKTALAVILLALAVTTKQWALIAVLPVLLAAPPRARSRIALAAGVVAALITLPALLVDPARFVDVHRMALGVSPEASLTTPLSLWWPLGEQLHPDIGWAELPAGLVQMTHPLIAVLPIPLALLYWRRGGAERPEDVLALLALLFLLRCVLDPYDNGYYHLPFLFSLAAYEGLCRQRFPLLSVLAAAVLWINIDLVWSDGHFDLSNAIYLASMLPLVGYLALIAFGSVGSRGRQRHPGSTGPALRMGWADRRQS